MPLSGRPILGCPRSTVSERFPQDILASPSIVESSSFGRFGITAFVAEANFLQADAEVDRLAERVDEAFAELLENEDFAGDGSDE